MKKPKEGEQVELKVIIHDDGKAFHVRPLVPKEDGAEYQCNKYERITTLVELTDDESNLIDLKRGGFDFSVSIAK